MFENLKKISEILTNQQKIFLIILFLLTLITVFFEIFSISLIIPVMQSLFNESLSENFSFIFLIKDFINIKSENTILVVSIFMILIFLLKSIYLQFFLWFKSKFNYNLMTSISKKIFKIYLFKKISYFFNQNSSDFLKNITVETQRFSLGYIEHLISIFVEFLIILSISIFLFLNEPIGFLVIISFYLTLIFTFFSFTKAFLKELGERRMKTEYQRLKSIQHGFLIHREISLMKKQSVFSDIFSSISNKFTNILFKEALVSRSPKIWLEFIAVSGLVIFLMFLTYQDYSNQNIIIIASLYAVAAFRLIPSVNKLVTSFVQMRYNAKVVDVIHSLLKDEKDLREKTFRLEVKDNIELKNLNFSYKKDKEILRDINFRINKGEFVGLYGGSGSGKTTLLNILLGLIKKSSGEIYIDGYKQDDFFYLQRKFSIVSQNIEILDATVSENITFKKNHNDEEKNFLKKVIEICCLTDFIKNLPKDLDENIGENGAKISGGQKQRIVLARALFFQPDLLVLDEATSALDKETERKILANIKEHFKDRSVVLVSHREEFKNYCDKIYNLNNGKIET